MAHGVPPNADHMNEAPQAGNRTARKDWRGFGPLLYSRTNSQNTPVHLEGRVALYRFSSGGAGCGRRSSVGPGTNPRLIPRTRSDSVFPQASRTLVLVVAGCGSSAEPVASWVGRAVVGDVGGAEPHIEVDR